MAIKLADTARPNNHVDAEHLGTFPVAYAEDVWFEDGTRLSEKTFGGDSIQKEELPLASADELGNIYQYIGETGTYTNGHFYKCILNSSTYSWSEIKMVENPVVYSKTVPDVNAYEVDNIVCYTGEDSGDFAKGHLYQKNETPFTYYYWTFYRDPEKTQPYVFYTREETLANGINVYQANPTTGEGDISLVGSITNYQEFSFFVTDSSTVQYFHPEADTSKNRIETESEWIDIGGGNAVGGIIDVEILPTSDIKNTFYRISNEIYLDYTSSVNKTYAEVTTDTAKITNVLDRAGINYSVETSEQFIVNEIIINDSNKLFLDIEKLVSDMYPSQPDKYSQYIGHYIQKIGIESDRLEINFDNSPSPSTYVIFSEKYNFRLFVASMPDEQIFMGDEKNNKIKELYNINIFTGTQAEWDALSTDEKKTYEQVNITDDDGGVNLDYYSTTETKTNKVWIDGKPIYRKVAINIVPNTHVSISDDIETVTNIFLSATSTNFTSSETYNWGSESGSVMSDVWRITDGGVHHNKFYCRGVGGIFSSGKLTLVVEYTKTTD